MASNLFPLVYSAGIQRDGTKFQSEYCLDGQWVRFQRGKVRKIGGMKGASTVANMQRVTDLSIFPWRAGGESLTFICGELGIRAQINSPDWTFISDNILFNYVAQPEDMWESETVVDTGGLASYRVFMRTKNALNINNSIGPPVFYRKNIATANVGGAEVTLNVGVNPLITGGLVFGAPYLFLYGSNGLVQFSTTNNPFIFTEGNGSGSIVISADKVIYGSPIRGGEFSPTILFWTLSSVVRFANTGLAGNDSFTVDVQSNSTSILSSKCVVEYDGIYFWPGTDRFFVYNGTVQELDNRLNLNYFYDNIDMDRRQQVFGVKNTKYGEIWWFYPVKGIPGANSRAIVYNKRENTWYDTNISRTAGVFSADFGFMGSYGRFLTDEQDPAETNLWKHEVSDQQDAIRANNRIISPIVSSFTTPVISWVAFPPKIGKGAKPSQLINRWIDLQRIEPDFVNLGNPGGIDFSVIVNTQEYAQSDIVSSQPQVFTNTTPKLDMRVQGRNMSLTFISEDGFEVGEIILLLGVGDAR
jgi:hypothetical protein